MTIVIDSHIPFIVEAVRSEWPNVDICPMESEEIDVSAVRNADVLIVRTRTRVDESLLAGSRVRLVCTATIGFDHIDTAYCELHGIQWLSCPGCNAQAVCDYIEEALKESASLPIFHSSQSPTIGIVGVGHVGSKVAAMAERNGYEVLLNDPPKNIGVSLDFIAQKCDIITFHVPLDTSTYHLCDAAFLTKCKSDALIINAARGGVVDEKALLALGHPFILDTWEGEPNIDPQVLDHAFLASMHIAGYSVEGKRNASQTCLDAMAQTFGLSAIDISHYSYQGSTQKNSSERWLATVSSQLKAAPTAFEALRKVYPLREG